MVLQTPPFRTIETKPWQFWLPWGRQEKFRLLRPTPEEVEITVQLAEGPDTYDWIDEGWANALDHAGTFPHAYEWALRQKKALDAGRV